MKKFTTLLVIMIAVICCFTACNATELTDEICALKVSQINESQKFAVTWDSKKELKEIDVKVTHGEQTVTEKTIKGDELKAKKAEIDAYYGKHSVTFNVTLENGRKYFKTTEITLSASEYVIAPISGSMPQLYFTLNLDEITKDGKLPTFVWLSRPGGWNWDKLPENVFPMPTVDKAEVLTHNNYDRMVEVTDAYIEELYSINKESKFNLYINDFNSYLYVKLLTANGIPEENYYVTLLSDGGASYQEFNLAFDSKEADFDADKKYDEMAKNLETLYDQAKEAKDYAPTSDFVVNTDVFRQYCYVCAREKDNVEWWILRPREGVLRSPDEEFIKRVLNDDKTEGIIEERNFASPLKEMNDKEKEALKALYNFDNEMFAEAEKQGKEAMMILGSWADAAHEPDFEAYVNLIKNFYGDNFVYYYKGHPNTPTSNYPDKQKQLEKVGLIDVESSINAELILFFHPDIYMCGYNSSTFLSVEEPKMACAIFNMSAEACEGEYKDLIGMYITKIEEPSKSPYAELCTDETHTYFLIDYHRYTTAEIGIYDAEADTITNYKLSDGKYQTVKN